MIQKFIIQKNNPTLLLFFAGWACDENAFRQYHPSGMDYMICYDYRNLAFDFSIFGKYDCINVVTWSMGVWAAAHILNQYKGFSGITIACNGTTHPIDDKLGIPVSVYEGTLQHLTPATLQKFLRRMCGRSDAYKAFMQITPRRDFEEIKEELQCVKNIYHSERHQDWHYDYAFLSDKDAIFPQDNLQAAHSLSHKINCLNSAHYEEQLFQFLLQDLWEQPVKEYLSSLKDYL